MTLTVIEETTEIDPEVAAAFDRFLASVQVSPLAGTPLATSGDLIRIAEAADQPLCVVWGRLCLTPHNLTLRSCCDTWVCEGHEDEHDQHCKEFEAQLREEKI